MAHREEQPAACRLYLVAPGSIPDPDGFLELLLAASEAADIASLLLPRDLPTPTARRLCGAAQDRGIAVLVADAPEQVSAVGADGVHLRDAGAYAAARRQLGSDMIVGVDCGTSRDAAMDAAEAGADYVSFTFPTEPDLDLVESWTLFITVPCVIFAAITPDSAASLARAGADFVALEIPEADAKVAAEAVALYARRITSAD